MPRVFGDADCTCRTLRFAWHRTTLAWWGLAALLVYFAGADWKGRAGSDIVSAMAAASGLAAGLLSRGRHLAWAAFCLVALATFLSSRL